MNAVTRNDLHTYHSFVVVSPVLIKVDLVEELLWAQVTAEGPFAVVALVPLYPQI